MIKRSRGVAGRMNAGVSFLMKKNKISVIWGEATIDAPGKVTVKASKTAAPKDDELFDPLPEVPPLAAAGIT